MIVVEGPDGGGKTTLIQKLSERLNLPIAPRVVNKDTRAMTDLKVWTEENTSQGFQPIIFDRHRLISEPIYGSLLRQEFQPGFDDILWMHYQFTQFYQFCQPIVIYCIPPYEEVVKNIENDPDNIVVKARIRRIYSLYAAQAAEALALRRTETFWYDYTQLAYREDILRAIQRKVDDVRTA